MYISAKELAQRKLSFRESFAPGAVDFRTPDFRQLGPLEVEATAELDGEEIRIAGSLRARIEQACARCLEPVAQEVARQFDLAYLPVGVMRKREELELTSDELEVGFYRGGGLFLADVAAEQVLLALPMKALCRADCRGLCPACGANLNRERCRCAAPAGDKRLAPLADWLEKKKSEH